MRKLPQIEAQTCEILNTKFTQLFRKIEAGDLTDFCDGVTGW